MLALRWLMLLSLDVNVCHSFVASVHHKVRLSETAVRQAEDCCTKRDDTTSSVPSRRLFGDQVAQWVVAISCALTVPLPVQARGNEEEEAKQKLLKGYNLLNYFLDNWVQETTICGRSGDNPYISAGGCERTPVKVMEYLGFKDINHPLFRADKTMRRLESLVPPDREVEYLEAIEKWMEAADEGSGMAFVSSWGEANPGGGKDRVELFIERARKNVVDSRDSLGSMIDIFDIKT